MLTLLMELLHRLAGHRDDAATPARPEAREWPID